MTLLPAAVHSRLPAGPARAPHCSAVSTTIVLFCHYGNLMAVVTPTNHTGNYIAGTFELATVSGLLKRMRKKRAKGVLLEAKEYCQNRGLLKKLKQVKTLEQKWKKGTKGRSKTPPLHKKYNSRFRRGAP